MTVLPVLLSVAYLVAPVRGWGLFEGRPLNLVSTVALAAVFWLWAARRQEQRTPSTETIVVGAALLLKIALGTTLLVPRGFEARYFANTRFEAPIQRSAEPADAAFTRVDRRLRFGFEPAPDVPVAFFNELRFSFFRDNEPKREGLPFSIMWQGLWRVTTPGRQRLYAHSPGGTLDLTIGDAFSEHIDASDVWTGEADLPAGFHRVMISWSVLQDGARRLDVGRVVDGREEPFDDGVILRRRVSNLTLAGDCVVRVISRILDAMLLAWLLTQTAWRVGRAYGRLQVSHSASDAVALAWIFGILDAIVFAAPAIGRMITLSGGDDWLTYESLARDIVLHGLLMTEGQPVGHGTPFFAQPFYAYFLAACHWLFGDGLSGIYFVQRLFVAGTVIALWRAVALVFDEKIGLAALVTGMVVAYQKLAGWSGVLLTEVLFTPLAAWWTYLLIRLAKNASDPTTGWRRLEPAVSAGVIGALATLTRSSLLAGWVLALPLVAIAIPNRRNRATALAVLVATMVAVCSLATVRNWVVAHRLVFITSEGPPTLLLGNPTPPLDTPPAYQEWYDRLGVDPRVQKVIEFARQRPLQFAAGLARKAQYTLGWFGTMLENVPTSRFYIAVWLLALIGVVLLRWIRPFSLALALVPFALAASHFVAMVLILPQVYVDRMIVPLYLLLVPSAALPVAAVARWGAATFRGRLPAVLCIVLLATAVLKMLGRLPAVDFDVLAVALLVAGVCVAGLPSARPWPLVVYVLYEVALAIWFLRSPSGDSAVALRTGSLFIATALASALFLNGLRAAFGWMCFALAAIGAGGLLRPGIPPLVVEQFTESLRNAFGYISSYAAAAGLVLAASALIVRTRPRLQRVLIYGAGAALMVPALHWVGAMITPQRALLQREMATVGIVGVVAYVLTWLDAAWPIGNDLSSRACQGMALGMFATIAFGTVIGHAGVAPTVAAGLLIGAIQADRSAPRYASTH